MYGCALCACGWVHGVQLTMALRLLRRWASGVTYVYEVGVYELRGYVVEREAIDGF